MSDNYIEINPSTRPVEENWQYFCHHYALIVDKYVPYKYSSTKYHIPWMSTLLKRMIRKKQRIYNKAKSSNCCNTWIEYKNIQKEVKQLLRSHHKQYLENIILSSNNRKPFWSYLKSKRQDKVGIGTLKSSNGDITTDSVQKVEVFSHHFQSVFTRENLEDIPDKGISIFPSIPQFQFTLKH